MFPIWERFLWGQRQRKISSENAHEQYLRRQRSSVVYSPMCYPDGVLWMTAGIQISDREYFVVVNAGNTDKSFDWLRQNLEGRLPLKMFLPIMLSWRFKGLNRDKSFKNAQTFRLKKFSFFISSRTPRSVGKSHRF